MIMRCFCDQPVMLHWLSLWLLHLPKLLLLLLVFLQQLLRLLLLLVFLQQLLGLLLLLCWAQLCKDI